MPFDAKQAFAEATVASAPSPATTGTALVVAADFPLGGIPAPFNIIVAPPGVRPLSSNAEICRVTAKAGTTWTIVRGQEGSTARAITNGDKVYLAITPKTFTDIESLFPTVYKKTSVKDVVNTTTKTDLLNGEITIGANVLGPNGVIKAWLAGDYKNNSAATRTIQLELKLGAVVIWSTDPSHILDYDTENFPWNCQFVIQALGVTNSQLASGNFQMNEAGGGAGLGNLNSVEDTATPPLIAQFTSGDGVQTAPIAVDMTVANLLTFSVIHSVANANVSMRLFQAWIEVVNPLT